MAEGGEMDADLMLATSARPDVDQREITRVAAKAPFDLEIRPGGSPAGADAVFDGDLTGRILAQGKLDFAGILWHGTVDDGDVFFLHRPIFPDFAQFPGG